MASDLASPASLANPADSQTAPDSTTFTLQIVSPSVGVPQPLVLQGLPADLNIKRLKERIRNAIATKPADQAQRLIHRGRLLSRENETMTEVFGEESLRSSDYQTLHLVLRDFSDGLATSVTAPHHHATTTNVPPSSQQSTGFNAPTQPQPQPQPQLHPYPHHAAHSQAQAQARVGVPHYHGVAFGFPQATMPGMSAAGQPINPPANLTPQQYNQWVRNMNMNLHMGVPNQNQRDRTATGPQGMPDVPHAAVRGTPGMTTSGRTASPFQPEATRTTIREGIAPNGTQWRITVNESFINPLQLQGRTGSPFSTTGGINPWPPQTRSVPNGGQLSNNDVQNMLRTVDANSATRAMTGAMRRNASTSSLANLASGQAHHPIPPGVTTPLIPSRAGSATGTPDPSRVFIRSRSPPTNQLQAQSFQATPEVYILSSPSGPRALLLNSSLDVYFNPPTRAVNQPMGIPFPQRRFPSTFVNNFNPHYMAPTPTTQPHTAPIGGAHIPNNQANNAPHQQAQAQPQHGLPPPPQVQPQIGHAVARADHAPVQAVRIAQLWPHVWMVIRLGLFIWWFTSPTSSWSRWITVISIAITLFLVNTGLLNPIAEQFWVPFRRHLENLIPLADGHHRNAQPTGAENTQGRNGDAAETGQQRELDPADTAARLVRQRRNANANWLMDQARRLERAGILFLASIAPGVAERHIAQMEEEVRAERQRREAEVVAAAASAQSDQAEEGAGQIDENGGSTPTAGESERHGQVAGDERGDARPPAAAEPLIAV
ncbi:hypothetical protein AAE478_004747 [Parahypoxylon ruwenzoriense]